MEKFTDQEVKELKELISNAGFKEFVQYVDIAAADYRLKSATRLIIKTWRQRALIIVGMGTMLATFWQNFTQNMGGILRWLLGQ